ncbi:MAG: XRE family transcriptional regulator [Ruminococcus sp.]|nr:XRE family transcriptional regulator [Ruminococcus sp.]
MEKSTEELMEILKSKNTYKDFFDQEIGELLFSSISEYLEMMLNEKGLKKSEVIEKSNLDKNYAYQIFNGNKTNPSRDKILMLAFGMRLTLEETRKLLKLCSLSDLYVRNPRDTVIIFCINKGMSLITCNEYLSDYSLDILE